MGILEGKRILVTGVLTDDSLAFGAARLAMDQGAEVALTGFGRGYSLTSRVARKLPGTVEVYELDATVEEQADRVASELEQRWGALDGVVHAIGFAPDSCLGSGVLPASWKDVSTALEVSTYSLKVLAAAFAPLLSRGPGRRLDRRLRLRRHRGVARLRLDGRRQGCPRVARPLPRPGSRPERASASTSSPPGPISTVAARSIPSFERFESVWDDRAPLGWDVRDSEAVARACVALLVGLVPADDGRDRPRRRRVPRHRRLTKWGVKPPEGRHASACPRRRVRG